MFGPVFPHRAFSFAYALENPPPITVKPTVGAGAPPYQSHSIPPDLLPWNSYEGSPSASELLRSFSQHSGHL